MEIRVLTSSGYDSYLRNICFRPLKRSSSQLITKFFLNNFKDQIQNSSYARSFSKSIVKFFIYYMFVLNGCITIFCIIIMSYINRLRMGIISKENILKIRNGEMKEDSNDLVISYFMYKHDGY